MWVFWYRSVEDLCGFLTTLNRYSSEPGHESDLVRAWRLLNQLCLEAQCYNCIGVCKSEGLGSHKQTVKGLCSLLCLKLNVKCWGWVVSLLRIEAMRGVILGHYNGDLTLMARSHQYEI